MSADGRFVAGPVPDLPGLWVASGCNGSGSPPRSPSAWPSAPGSPAAPRPPGLSALSPGRFGALPDDALLSRGLWQYAHYYDPVHGAADSGNRRDGAALPCGDTTWRASNGSFSRQLASWEVPGCAIAAVQDGADRPRRRVGPARPGEHRASGHLGHAVRHRVHHQGLHGGDGRRPRR